MALQTLGPRARILRRQRMIGISSLQMIDDRPKTRHACAVEIGKDGKMIGAVIGAREIAGEALLADHKTNKTRRRRQEVMGQTTHGGGNLIGQARDLYP